MMSALVPVSKQFPPVPAECLLVMMVSYHLSQGPSAHHFVMVFHLVPYVYLNSVPFSIAKYRVFMRGIQMRDIVPLKTTRIL